MAEPEKKKFQPTGRVAVGKTPQLVAAEQQAAAPVTAPEPAPQPLQGRFAVGKTAELGGFAGNSELTPPVSEQPPAPTTFTANAVPGTTPAGQQPGSSVGVQTFKPVPPPPNVQPVGENIGTSASQIFAQGTRSGPQFPGQEGGKPNNFSATGRVYADKLTAPTKVEGELTPYEHYQRGLAVLRGTDQNLRAIENQEEQFGQNLEAENRQATIRAEGGVQEARLKAGTEAAKIQADQDKEARKASDNLFKDFADKNKIPEAELRSFLSTQIPEVNKFMQDRVGPEAPQFPTDRPLNQQEAAILLSAYDEFSKSRRNYNSSTWQSTFYPPPSYTQSLSRTMTPQG